MITENLPKHRVTLISCIFLHTASPLTTILLSDYVKLAQVFVQMLVNIYCIYPKYFIQPNNHTYPYKRTVKQFRSHHITASVGICCGYPFELHGLVDAIQIRTHNICFYKENHKNNHKNMAKASFDDISMIFFFFFF